MTRLACYRALFPAVFAGLATAGSAAAQTTADLAGAPVQGIDARINEAIGPVADVFAGVIFYSVPVMGANLPLIVVWLVTAAVFFTFYFGFINFRGFGHALRLVRGDYEDPNDRGEVSHFQALTAALSGTVGLGNIAGVAIAVSLGGPGATFWMILAGLLGMTSKFTECTLGVKYRRVNPDGTVSGGPMYYLSQGLAERGMGGLGRFLAVFFAIMCVGGSLGGGNMFQINQAFQQFVNVTGGDASPLAGRGWIFGLVAAVLVGIVIIGGIRSIVRVTEKIVPLMCGLYVLAGLVIILVHWADIPAAVSAIVIGAFSPEGVAGGFVGVLIQGFRRAAFSNEAGIGSAAIAHSAVRTKEPVTEGYVALLEPFVDTVIVCTVTALVIVITGTYGTPDTDGVSLTSQAFGSTISWFPYVLAVAVILFAFSTMISWSYYGLKSWTYLFGETRAADVSFKLLFCVFVVIGSSLQLGAVVDFSDAMIFAMSLPNLIGLYLLAPVVRRELAAYRAKLRSGEIRAHQHVPPAGAPARR
ncbi:alanine/glycine:cation symporter family protein [Skermanella pratensis]|uniref:alanine/glycine:cation symporter family protein n=1 Tax=Skermanella pratensis TaxID=2233999 RepID=UPI00130140DC|nr:alanine/glycine:cation symporter family protein [Skermanella pratensis]